MSDGSTFHFHTVWFIPVTDRLLHGCIVDKDIAGNNSAGTVSACHFRDGSTGTFTQSTQCRVSREKCTLRIIVQHDRILIVEADLTADDNIQNVQAMAHSTGNAHIDNAVGTKALHSSSGTDSCIDFTYTAADQNDILSMDGAFIIRGAEQWCFPGNRHFPADQLHFCVQRTENTPFHMYIILSVP